MEAEAAVILTQARGHWDTQKHERAKERSSADFREDMALLAL